MAWLHLLSCFCGGAFMANAVPHVVAGMMGHRFQSPFAKPPGQGLSSSTVNVLWGFFNLIIGSLFVCRLGHADVENNLDILAVSAGAVLIALFLARHFGRFNGGTATDQS